MPPVCMDPEVETLIEEEPAPVQEPESKPPARNERLRNLLVTIFAGHEEFLGWTPD